MPEVLPSKVLEIVPNASTAQLGDFLELAEASARKGKKRRRRSARNPSRSKSPSLLDAISLSGQSPVPEEKGLESPTEVESKLMMELKKLIPPKHGGSPLPKIELSSDFQSRILDALEASNTPSRFDTNEKVYQKLKKDPLARSRPESLFAARAHK